MRSGKEKYLSNHKTLGIHVSLEELKRYTPYLLSKNV